MATDSFAYSDGTLGTVSSGAWDDIDNSFDVVSQQVQPHLTSYCVSAFVGTFAADQYAECKIPGGTADNLTSFAGPAVRINLTSGACYCICFQKNPTGSTWRLRIGYYGGAGISSASAYVTFSQPASTDVFRLEVSGSNLTAKINGTTIQTWSHATLTDGNPGLIAYAWNAVDAWLMDDWAGDALSSWTLYNKVAEDGLSVIDAALPGGHFSKALSDFVGLADSPIINITYGPKRYRARHALYVRPRPSDTPFPLRVEGTALMGANGRPFLFAGDTVWSLEVQPTTAQIDTYLNDRQSRGINTVLLELIEHYYSSQTPAYLNAYGNAPFTTMSPVAWDSPNAAYWSVVDYIVNGAMARGMVVVLFPAYFGYNDTQGWRAELVAASDAALQAYGAFLASRYRQTNIIWCMGGDKPGTVAERQKQWLIVTGMQSVRSDLIVTGHGSRNSDAYASWNGYSGFNLNASYVGTDNICDNDCTTARGRGMPFFIIEGGYEGEGATAATVAMCAWTAVLSGAHGYLFGNNPLWGLGEPNANGGLGPADALANDLNTAGAQQMSRFAAFFGSFEWWKLQPKTDASLVTSSLGTTGTTSRICPALSVDGDFAAIWVPSGNATLTVAMSQFTRLPLVRARWYDPSDGSYSTIGTYPNGGQRSFTAPGDRVLMLDRP